MNLNRPEFRTSMRGGFEAPPGWEPEPHRPYHQVHHQGSNGPYFPKPDGTSRNRGAVNGPQSPPTPLYFPANPSYPPGFDNGRRHPQSYDNHSEIHFQESLEITSDRPFLPRRRDSPDGCVVSADQISRGQSTRGEVSGSTQSIPRSCRGRDCETPDGGSTESSHKRKRKKSKFSAPLSKNGQPAHTDTIVLSESPCEEEMPPPVSRSGGATGQKSPTNSAERAAKVCQKLWEDLNLAMQQRERVLRQKEQSFTQSNMNKETLEDEKKEIIAMQIALEEEKKQASAMKNEILEERRKLDLEMKRIREEKDAMERTSTEIALQMVELKQVQKQIEKEKATLLALKAHRSAKARTSEEEELVEVDVTTPLGIVKAEIETPVVIPCGMCGQSVPRESEARQSDNQSQEPRVAGNTLCVSKSLPVVSNRNFESVKVEFVTSGSDAAHGDKSRLDGNSSEDNMDDVPLAHRLKSQRVEKKQEKRRVGEKSTQQEESNAESSRRRKPVSYDIHMKRNNVAIEVALQEDAPGLLEQLEEKGLLEDMRVYHDMGVDESFVASESPECEFGQLEGVIGKLWGAGAGLAKDLIPIKGQQQGSGIMPRYCLACLLSLIEQTKVLRKRNWSVEWGWCRRLRAFVFVFEKHNRVVLERPEYGYATYFFELVQGLPIKWQVQRLITVMSVASNGRAALLENRQLVVGTDLTVEDASILEDYGWNRSSGMGSLLNFCDRVVHDYNKGQDPAELGNDWKQKIGKLLMDGYDQGSIVATSIPKKLEKVLRNNSGDAEPGSGSDVKAEPV